MKPLLRLCAIISALLATGCSSWTPSLSFLSSGANVSLTIESDPPGADASTSLGPSCRTPCMLPVPAGRSFTVSYSLNGYLPQAIQVSPRTGYDTTSDVAGGDPSYYGAPLTGEVTPNPVYAQLQRAHPLPPAGRARDVLQKTRRSELSKPTQFVWLTLLVAAP
jgi:hypothetical protein